MAAGAVAVPQIIALSFSPGSSVRRNAVDAGTKIEISTDTPGANVYFTTDGSRPGERSTRKYRHAFTLPPGKYVIRAVAVAHDGRESAVASRSINVVGTKGARVVDSETPRSDGSRFVDEMSSRSEHGSTRPFSKEAFSRNLHAAWAEEQQAVKQTLSRNDNSYITTTAALDRSQVTAKESVQPRLVYAGDVTQLYTCARCGLRLPTGASRCVVCECDSVLVTAVPSTPVPTGPATQVVPMSSTSTWNAVSCLVCGVSNPVGIPRCLSCSAALPADMRPAFYGTAAPPMPAMSTSIAPVQNSVTHVRCTTCSRLNDARARFCDWCAARLPNSQPIRDATQLCSKCGSPLLSLNRPCYTCGTFAVAPTGDIHASNMSLSKLPSQTRAMSAPLRDHYASSAFTAADTLRSTTDNYTYKLTKATQTIQTGSFIPTVENTFSSPRNRNGPPLSSLSPGRGYWRQQLRHVNAQLEAFASSSADFRAAIGPHQLGRLLAARVTNSGGDEFVVRLVFNLPQAHNQRTNLSGRDTTRYGRPAFDRGSVTSGVGSTGRHDHRYPPSEYSLQSSRMNPKSNHSRYGESKYADIDDYSKDGHYAKDSHYAKGGREHEHLPIEELSIEDDDDLITGTSDDDTSDRDILDTFREDSARHQSYHRPGRKTNHNFLVSATPRRSGRRATGSTSLASKRRQVSAVDIQAQNKPTMLALKELGVDGAGRIEELTRLFSEMDVDPALKSRDGWSLAHLAVINRHPDCIPVIAQYAKGGEDTVAEAVSSRGPPNAFGNTPLHEAVRLSTSSSSALRALDALLSCGADVGRRNDRGETPFEYAQRLGHTDAAKRIASSMGQRRLKAAGLVGDSRREAEKKSDKNAGLSD